MKLIFKILLSLKGVVGEWAMKILMNGVDWNGGRGEGVFFNQYTSETRGSSKNIIFKIKDLTSNRLLK